MDTAPMFALLAAAFGLAYGLFYLLHKPRTVPRKSYEHLEALHRETQTSLRISEDRLASRDKEAQRLGLSLQTMEKQLESLRSLNATQETTRMHREERIRELTHSMEQLAAIQETQQQRITQTREELAQANANNRSWEERYRLQAEAESKLAEQVASMTARINQLTQDNSYLSAAKASLQEKLSQQQEAISDMQRSSHLQFERIANQILEEKSGKFTELNRTNLEAMLKPLGENIDHFKTKVEETYDKESRQRFSLEQRVKELVEQTNKVSAEANNLASALKGQAKKQGNWGEVILESILQKSGLVRDREYYIQKNIRDDQGRNFRPDVLVNLPDNRIIIVDSKVSLVAYDRFSSAETPEEQALHLREHLRSIYGHIDDLQGKQYDNLEASLDFTMMFIPIEPAYVAAMQGDPELWAYAYSRRILLISPTNLIACLKLIADLWKREMQSKNAMDIVKRGELLYEKFVSFTSSLEDIGKHLHKSQEAYNNALGQLSSGTGNLVGQAMKLKSLGLKSSKEIPPGMLPNEMDGAG